MRNNPKNKIKIAIVHDWLVTYAGAEKVLENIIEVFPNADIFSLIDCVENSDRRFLHNKDVKTSFMQLIPNIKKIYRKLLPIMPFAIQTFNLRKYNLIISSSHAVAKGVITNTNQLHICYCHTPMRYAWDMKEQYLKQAGLSSGILSKAVRFILDLINKWDKKNSIDVDYFISNSDFIKERIQNCYQRESYTIYPPVDILKFKNSNIKKNYYFTFSRFVPYKNIDLIARAFATYFPNKKLIIAGAGPDYEKIKFYESENIILKGFLNDKDLIEYLSSAKAYIFAAKEDFGIVNVESQAAGTPVIAYGEGGSKETIVNISEENPTGVLYYKQDMESIRDAVFEFEKNYELFKKVNLEKNSKRFSVEVFKSELLNFVEKKLLKS